MTAIEAAAVVTKIETETEAAEIEKESVTAIEVVLAVEIEIEGTGIEETETEGIVMSETAIEEMVTETAEIGDRDQGDPEGHRDAALVDLGHAVAVLVEEIKEIEEMIEEEMGPWTSAVTVIEKALKVVEVQRLHGLQHWNQSRGSVSKVEVEARAAVEARVPAVHL